LEGSHLSSAFFSHPTKNHPSPEINALIPSLFMGRINV